MRVEFEATNEADEPISVVAWVPVAKPIYSCAMSDADTIEDSTTVIESVWPAGAYDESYLIGLAEEKAA